MDNSSDSTASKKFGFFASEAGIANEIFEQTGLEEGMRHPLAYIMEACDDIAYSVLDAEDSVKKQLVSFNDLMSWLEQDDIIKNDELAGWVRNESSARHKLNVESGLSPSETNDVSTQMFRVYAIHGMISALTRSLEDNYLSIMKGDFHGDLIEKSAANTLCKYLKMFDRQNAYQHRSVLEVELEGYNAIHELMNMLWRGIIEREDFPRLDSKRTSPFASYVFGRISENYRRIFEGDIIKYRKNDPDLPIRYREMQLLTDMVSGMTDSFALELLEDLRKYHVGPSSHYI